MEKKLIIGGLPPMGALEPKVLEADAATFQYNFGFITRAQARRTFRCNVLTGLINKVNLDKTQLKDKKTGQVKTWYSIQTTRNYVYIVAKDLNDARAKIEKIFADKDEQYQKLLQEKEAQEEKKQ